MIEQFESTSNVLGLASFPSGLLDTHNIYLPSLHHVCKLSAFTSHCPYVQSPYSNLHTPAFPSLLFDGLRPTVVQFPPAPCWSTAPEAVVVNPGLDRSGMAIIFVIRMIVLAQVLRRMPFLTQPSPFIRAWDRHQKYTKIRLRPRILRDVSVSDIRTTVLGTEISFPVGIAPTAFHCLAWHEGELATARATEAMNTCYITSTYSTCSVEEICAAAPNGYRWFQLYVYRDRKISEQIVHRVEALGYKALVLTVDVPYTGKRRDDIRNQFKLPPHLKVKNFDGTFQDSTGPEEYGIPAHTLDPSISWKDVHWLQSLTHLPIIIKGILTKEDAELAVEHGVQGIIVSNHGGRQLDGGPATIDCLSEIVDTVQGRIEVYMDGGIRTGSDVLKALALGAKCVFIGRPAIWGLAYKGLDQFRSDKTLCDVTLVPGDSNETFQVHRVIMASSSDYFKAMFTGGMKEQELEEIKLHGVSTTGLKNIIEFIYTSHLSLNLSTLQDTLEAASFLQVLPVLNFCNQLLSSEVTIENCAEVERIASDLLLEDVQTHVYNFVCQNFAALVQNERFLQLSEATIAYALSSDSLKGFSEMELYRAARAWLAHKPSERRPAAYSLMRHVRFPLMTPAELLQISQEDQTDEGNDGEKKAEEPFMRSNTACVNLLLEASNYQMLPFLQPALQTERTCIRSDTTHLLALGGVMRQQLVVSKELRLYDEEGGGTWRALQPMEVPRYQHGVALLGGFLYIVGGQSTYDTKGKTAVDSAYRYDPRFDRWLQVASLNEKRTFFHLSALKGKLYAVGGRNASGEIDTVECYNLSKNEWTFVSPMSEPHYGHAGTVHGGLMFVSGGITRDAFQKELSCYDPDTDSWSRRADMMELRGLHCMCTVGNRLYVMGGNHFRGTNDYDDVLSCEYYSPATDQWTLVAPMPRGQSDVGVAVFKGKIYVVGGYSWNSRCMVDIVQCYDPEKDEWERVFNVLEPLGGIRACTMTVHRPEGSVDEAQIQECPLPTAKN
ncbi:hypothetical protein SRHO_G00109960 [Serrasalmus rhombeus]